MGSLQLVMGKQSAEKMLFLFALTIGRDQGHFSQPKTEILVN